MRIEASHSGHDRIFVPSAIASKLALFLNKEVEYVWVLGHMPNRYAQWWETTVPLNRAESIRTQVRLLAYDLQLSTSEFLDRVNSFDDHGLALIQSHKPMPDTLHLSRIPENQQDNILIKNGAFLRLWLPHAFETACVTCYEPGYLATIHEEH